MRFATSLRQLLAPAIAVSLGLLLLVAAGASAAPSVHVVQEYGEGLEHHSSFEGMGVDPVSGKVVAADSSLQRVAVFSAGGKFLRAFGKDVVPGGDDGPEVCTSECNSGALGDGPGELNYPEDAEVSPDGLIYVSDAGNYRISVFTMAGKFKFAFGMDVDPGGGDGPEVCTDECQRGKAGPAGGGLNYPWASTFGPDGDFYVAATDHNAIERFTPEGEPVATYGGDVSIAGGDGGFEACTGDDCRIGANNGTAGTLNRPEGVDFDPEGRLWASSWDDSQVSALTTAPSFEFGLGKGVDPEQTGFGICTSECTFGGTGTDPGELTSAQGVAVDASGNVYVADSDNSRINSYGPDGSFRFAFGYDVIPGGDEDLEVCTIDTDCQSGPIQPSALTHVYPVAVDCRGTVYAAGSASTPAAAFALRKKAKPGPCKLKPGTVKLNRKRGTAKLKVLVPYAGKLTLKGKGIKRARGSHQGLEGNEGLTIKPAKKLKRKLRKKGKAKVKITVTMRPSDGNVVQKRSKRITLKKKRKRR